MTSPDSSSGTPDITDNASGTPNSSRRKQALRIAGVVGVVGVLGLGGKCGVEWACRPTGEMTDTMKEAQITRERAAALVKCLEENHEGKMSFQSDAGRVDALLSSDDLTFRQHVPSSDSLGGVYTLVDGLEDSSNGRILVPKIDGVFDHCYWQEAEDVKGEIKLKERNETPCSNNSLNENGRRFISQGLDYCEATTDIPLPNIEAPQ